MTQHVLGRRAFLGTSSAVVAGAAVAKPSRAAAATPASYAATDLPSPAELHWLRRLTYGYTLEALQDLRAAASPAAWLEAQLNPASVAESPNTPGTDWFYSLTATTAQIVDRDKKDVEDGWRAMANYACYRLLKRVYSKRQVLELMTEFWEDHLYIPRDDDGVWPFRTQFGMEMERLALSSFEELLLASTTHPAMGCSLDNARSKKTSVNENLGRELLELHTVGQGQYSEEDVKASARILTGYRVEMWSTWNVTYDTAWHYVGPVKVMDFEHTNTSSDGRACTEAYLRYLARHPATARRICRKLAKRFVSDTPSTALVDTLAQVYLEHQTQIKPVLRALFASPEFLSAANAKVKTPTDECVSMYRTLGTRFLKPVDSDSGAATVLWQSGNLGQIPWDHPRPDGPPMNNDAWTNPSRFLASWDVHYTSAGGWWPTRQVEWVPYASRLPQASLTLAELVDHLARKHLGEASTPALLDAVVTATKVAPTATITSSHAIARWQMPTVLTLILNHPSFYLR